MVLRPGCTLESPGELENVPVPSLHVRPVRSASVGRTQASVTQALRPMGLAEDCGSGEMWGALSQAVVSNLRCTLESHGELTHTHTHTCACRDTHTWQRPGPNPKTLTYLGYDQGVGVLLYSRD